ncbi:hypothetical protein CRYUN_Cryun33cG0055700 [Craigia yunnanensis]
MAARKHSDDRKFCSIEKQQFVIFDCSNHFIRDFCSRPEHHYGKFDRLKRVAVHALEITTVRKRTKSLIHFKEDFCGEDSDVKSDAESLPWSQRDVATDVSENERCLNNLFHDEGTRKKLKLLAGMVGADSMEPRIVLAEVVSVLKDF